MAGSPHAGSGVQLLLDLIMSLTIGIVGLPNVGKSTMFNALTRNNVLAENTTCSLPSSRTPVSCRSG